jgi:hypothetical protein
MKEGTTLGARAQSAIQRAAVLYKPRLATFKKTKKRQNTTVICEGAFYLGSRQHVSALALGHLQVLSGVLEETIQCKGST